MPFTLVHPAAVVPLARSPLVPSALVVGAMAPDLPYYVSLMWIGGDYNLTLTHRATSLLWLDPLIALVLLAVFHVVLKHPLAALSPRAAAGRLLPVADRFAWRSPAWIVASLVIGATTHLGWDALCDAFGYAWSTRLNLASDVVGGLVLLGWLWSWWRSTSPQHVEPRRLLTAGLRNLVVGAIVLLTLAWTGVRGVRAAADVGADLREDGGWSRSAVAEHVVRQGAVDIATALVVLVGVYAIAWHLRRLASRRD